MNRFVMLGRALRHVSLVALVGTVAALLTHAAAEGATAPTAPTINAIGQLVDGTYTTTDRQPSFSGTAERGDSVQITINGVTVLPPATAGANGDWSITVGASQALAVGTYSISATACASGGKACSLASSILVTELPDTPSIITPTSGGSTTDRTPLITGTADGGDQVSVYLDGASVSLGTADVNSSGGWNLPVMSQLAVGTHTLTAVAVDPISGLESSTSNPDSFKVIAASDVNPAGIQIDQNVTLTFDGSFRSRCSLMPELIRSCAVTAYVGGKQIAYGIHKLAASGAHSTIVVSKLDRTGRALLRASGPSGLHVDLKMKLIATGGSTFTVNGRTIAYRPFAKLAFTVHFPFNKATLTKAQVRTITAEAKRMKGESVVLCDGNTDSVGSWSYNYALGIRRGKAVCSLLRKLGIRTRVGVRSYSYDYPVASNSTAAGRALNRRTAVWVTFADSF